MSSHDESGSPVVYGGEEVTETECTTGTNSLGLSCHALVAAVAKVSHLRFRDARVLFDPIIREAALIWMQELDVDSGPGFDRLEDAIVHSLQLMPDMHDFRITTTPGGAIQIRIGNTCPFRPACQIMNEKIGAVEGCAEAITLLQIIEHTYTQSDSLTYDFQPAQRPNQACTLYIGTVEQIVLNQECQNLYND
ncbi:MAG: hypothetical protein GWP10_12880 [Nitrospiraceae bacterium]|nr:hypothetical protein [Nitrospiraceae bacterium]